MKRLLSFVAITISSVVLMIVGQAQEHQSLVYIGVVIGGLLGITLIVHLGKFLCRIIGSHLTSTAFLIACAITITILTAQGIISIAIAYPAGIAIGFMLSIAIIRAVAKRAETSFLFGDMFSWATGYEIRAYIRNDVLTAKQDAVSDHNDFKNISHILQRSLGLSKNDAEKAAEYAVMITPTNAPIEDKIQSALQFHGKTQ